MEFFEKSRSKLKADIRTDFKLVNSKIKEKKPVDRIIFGTLIGILVLTILTYRAIVWTGLFIVYLFTSVMSSHVARDSMEDYNPEASEGD